MIACTACGDSHPDGTATCAATGVPVSQGGPCHSRVDRYDVLRWIGGGGMGAVYAARHATMGTPVALKLLHPRFATDADVVGRLVREARVAASIGNAHIVRVLDVGVSPEGAPFLAMELLEGRSLEARLLKHGAMEPARAIDVALQILDALGAAHAVGIVHRDMKPANVLLTPWPDATERDRDFVKLVDFGVSRALGAEGTTRLTHTGVTLGTPFYMAPEQFLDARTADHRADLYATGVLLYQALSNALPYHGDNAQEALTRVLTEPPRPLPSVAPWVPEAIVRVVDRALAKDPSARWQSAIEFANALRDASAIPSAPRQPVQSLPNPATRDNAWGSEPRAANAVPKRGGSRVPWIVAGCALVALAATVSALGWYVTHRDEPADESAPSTPAAAPPSATNVGSTEEPAPAPAPAPVEAVPEVRDVRFPHIRVRGMNADQLAIAQAVQGTLPAMRACGQPGHSVRAIVMATVFPGGQITSARPQPGSSDMESARCVAGVVLTLGRLPGAPGFTTVEVHVLLPPQ